MDTGELRYFCDNGTFNSEGLVLQKRMDYNNSYKVFNEVLKFVKGLEEDQISLVDLRNATRLRCQNAGLKITNSSFLMHAVKRMEEAGWLSKLEGYKFKVNREIIKASDYLSVFNEKPYVTRIRSLAVNLLKERKNEPISLKEIFESFKEHYPLGELFKSKASFYKIFNDNGVFQKNEIEGKVLVSLRLELLPIPQPLAVEVQVPEIIEESEVEELNSVEVITAEGDDDKKANDQYFIRAPYNLDLIKSDLQKELNFDFNITKDSQIFNNGFEAFIMQLRKSDGSFSRWGDSLLQSLFDLLRGRSDYYDREAFLQKVVDSFETYIGTFSDEIRNEVGMQRKISANIRLQDLANYKHDVEFNTPGVDRLKLKMSKNLSSLHYYRNIMTHNKAHENLEMGMTTQVQNIFNFISLYIYVGNIL
jgi:hypothetical protein